MKKALIFILSIFIFTAISGVDSNQKKPTKKVAYKVLRKAPTVKFNVIKRSNGNQVFFSFHNGRKSFPHGFTVYTSNGKKVIKGRKHGVEQVNFPVKCTLYCSNANTNNPNNDMAHLLNEFEIEFYEPGNWEVSFVR